MDNFDSYCLRLLKLESETRTRMLIAGKQLDDFSLTQYIDRLTYKENCFDFEIVSERLFKVLECRIRAYLLDKAFMHELQERWAKASKRFDGRDER